MSDKDETGPVRYDPPDAVERSLRERVAGLESDLREQAQVVSNLRHDLASAVKAADDRGAALIDSRERVTILERERAELQASLADAQTTQRHGANVARERDRIQSDYQELTERYKSLEANFTAAQSRVAGLTVVRDQLQAHVDRLRETDVGKAVGAREEAIGKMQAAQRETVRVRADFERFKERLVTRAAQFAATNDWCEEIADALEELGCELPDKEVAAQITVRLPWRFAIPDVGDSDRESAAADAIAEGHYEIIDVERYDPDDD